MTAVRPAAALVLALALAVALGIRPAAAAGGPDRAADIARACAADWPDDYAMQETCIRRQTGAAKDILVLYRALDGKPDKRLILAKCLQDWRRADGLPDYVMVKTCAVRQLRAYNSLHDNP